MMYLQIIGPDHAKNLQGVKHKPPLHDYVVKGCWKISGFQVFPEILKVPPSLDLDTFNKLPSVRIAKQVGFTEELTHHTQKLSLLMMYARIEGESLAMYVSFNDVGSMLIDIVDLITKRAILTLNPTDWDRILIKNETFHTCFENQASQEQDFLYILDNKGLDR